MIGRERQATGAFALLIGQGAPYLSLRRPRGSERGLWLCTVNISAATALRGVLAAGLLVMLGANLPGHLSYDSVAQLYEGHFHIRETFIWGPALYAWMLGFFDRFVPGTALYVTTSGVILTAALASMTDLRPRTSWLAVAVAAALVLTPQLLIYQGIVWKDVMFANSAIAGTICLAHAARSWSDARRRWILLLLALLLIAAGTQVRQTGIIAGAFAALALGWIGGHLKPARGPLAARHRLGRRRVRRAGWWSATS